MKDNTEKVWQDLLDEKYNVFVERIVPYNGELVVMEGDKELHREKVNISYDAKFGPDYADLIEWQDRAIKVVDKLNK